MNKKNQLIILFKRSFFLAKSYMICEGLGLAMLLIFSAANSNFLVRGRSASKDIVLAELAAYNIHVREDKGC